MALQGKRPFVQVSTADHTLTDIQRNMSAFAAQLEEIRRGLVAFAPMVVAGDYTIGEDTFVVYTGAGGHAFTLPKADALTGKARAVFLMNIGPGTLTLKASGADALKGSGKLETGESTMAVADGAATWATQTPLLNGVLQPWYSFITKDPSSAAPNGTFWARREDATLVEGAAGLNIGGAFRWTYSVNANGHAMTGPIFGWRISTSNIDLSSMENVMLQLLDQLTGAELFRVVHSPVSKTEIKTTRIGEYGAAAVAQCAHIPHATDLATAITAINDLLTYFESRGTVAP